MAIDKLGNAIAGGNHNCTVSGRVGYYQYNAKKPWIFYWKFLAVVIDAAFFPLDSHHHCREAYLKEKNEKFSDTKNIAAIFVLSILTLVSCAAIAIVTWSILLVKTLIKKFRKNA
jgi:hypothetical protein